MLKKIAITLLLALAIWLPRGLALDRFVAVDERSWLTRAGNFYLALNQGDLSHTFQRYHPGVTTMWLGMAGYLWRYPDYATTAATQIGDMSEGVEGFLRAHGHQPLELLAAGRTFVVLAETAALLVAFWIAVGLVGLLPALAGFLLLAFDPFALGLTRMLHVDGLSSVLMFLAVLAYARRLTGDSVTAKRAKNSQEITAEDAESAEKKPGQMGRGETQFIEGVAAEGTENSQKIIAEEQHKGWDAARSTIATTEIATEDTENTEEKPGQVSWVEVQPAAERTAEDAESAEEQRGHVSWVSTQPTEPVGAEDAGARWRPDRYLVMAGVAAGLAWLTKSPALFLIPFMALLAGLEVVGAWRRQGRVNWRVVRGPALDFAVWLGVGALVFVLLWPAMWVQPLESLRQIFSAAGEESVEGHSKAIFFDGQALTGDPGAWFYPITYLWRTTPIVLAGLALAVVAAWLRWTPFAGRTARAAAGYLTLYALGYALLMTIGAKKFDRYLLPVYLPLDLLAGMGWATLAVATAQWLSAGQRKWLPGALVAIPVLIQAGLALPHYPYYFTYYNPLLGGTARAPQVMMIGLGEGLDEAARYLNAKPDAQTVASWYRGGSFNYIFDRNAVDIDDFYQADYAVTYAHQWQRQVPSKRMMDYFATLTPEHVVALKGLEYARIYNLQGAPPPAYFTEWADAIRLVGHDVPDAPVTPGAPFVVRLRLQSIAPLEKNLNVLVRLVGADGAEVARSEAWPFGKPTSTWQPGEVYVDGHEFTLEDVTPGYYRVEVAFDDPAAQALITPTVAGTDVPRPDLLPLDYVAVGAPPEQATWAAPVSMGDQISLVGAQVDGQTGIEPGSLALPVQAGTSVPITLSWRMDEYVPTDYTVLLHLIGPDGEMAAQGDGPPLQGVALTSLWRAGDTLYDRHDLALPAELPPGEYRLLVGLYDLATLERLPVTVGGQSAGDTIEIAKLVTR